VKRPMPSYLDSMSLRPLALTCVFALASATLGACAESDQRTPPEPDAEGSGGQGGGTGGEDMPGDGDGDGDGDGAVDAAVTCRLNPDADTNPGCPQICPEACNEADDDCDGVVDEGADDTDCAVDHATSICTRGLCILSACDDGFRDCDGEQDNGCEVDISTPDNCGACGNECEFDNLVALCVDGVCEPGACAEPYLDCDDDDSECETLGETLSDCGACGSTCPALARATPICMDGACAIDECVGNFGDCNDDATDGCELALNEAAHCGGCDIPCAFAGSATNCDSGTCVVDACSPGHADCDGSRLTACESLDSDPHCGACGQACTVDILEHVTAAGCDTRSCVFECMAGFGDCDGAPNGCETPLTGVNNCAGCGNPCSPDHAVGDCGDGTCQVGVCDSGWADCDGDPSNGCETDAGRPENCGGCGVQCQVSPPIGCNGGVCTGVLCPEGGADCDGDDTCEADLSDDATCGGCNVQCTFDNNVNGHGSLACTVENNVPGQMAWGCEVSCTDGFADCDGDYRNGCEVDLTDLNNCGGCGSVCTKTRATPTCENRVCQVDTCDPDWADCDNDDLDCETQLNTANDCGACGNECDFPFAAGLCSGSPGNRSCIIQQCVPVEHENCDGQLGTGCEADTRSDALHCNGCGNDCTSGPQVQGGSCIDSACSYSCAPNYRDCTGALGCETNLLAAGSCGDCGNDCFALAEVTSATCLPGGGNPVCNITTCDGGYGDCNGDPGDGCEAPTSSSETHCGACSGDPGHQPCANLTGVDDSTCNAGLCVINDCTGNLVDCNGVSADGCEWDPGVDGMCCDPNLDDDSDGSDNCADGCPTDPAKVAPGICGCFVADTDSDGDGSANCIEDCDNDPGKTVPGTCGCGTPDVDGDGDGLLVCQESCDADPLKQDPGLCGCGRSDADYPGCQGKRKALTIQGSQVPAAQSDFPVLVRLTSDADLAANADGSGLDIYFEDAGGNPLPFERVSYAAGSLEAWVQLDLGGNNQVFYVFYGGGDLTEKSTPATVWSNGFTHVWHLEEDPGAPVDSAGAVAVTSSMDAATNQIAGIIGNGADFNPESHNSQSSPFDYMEFAHTLSGSPALTASAWVNQRSAAGAHNNFFQLGSGPSPNDWEIAKVVFRTKNGSNPDRLMTAGFNNTMLSTGVDPSGWGWFYFTWTYDGGSVTAPAGWTNTTRVYRDGAQISSGAHTGDTPNVAGTLGRIGNRINNSMNADNALNAQMDEIRFSWGVKRSANWIATEYNNQVPGSTFISVGAEESL